ncbi:MAG: FAD-dependent oxidoreductase, partial [Pseudobdellovibrionaceae bacterium]
IKPDALHIWPRGQFMMMALANLDQSFTVTLYMPEKANTGPSFDQLVTDEQIADFFQQQFPDSVGLVNAANPARGDAKPSVLVNDFKSNPSMPLGNLRLNQWVYKDSVAILGDASHGIVPFFGQGMNSGFEDCSDLISLMDKTSDWHSLLDQLQTLRKPNADAIADMAVENWFEMSERVADPKFILRKKVEVILEEKIPQDFKSRYGMVTYTQIPYAQVQYLGNLQNQIFQKLLTHVDQIEDVDFEKAKLLIHDHYTPEYRKSLSVK